MERIIEFRGYSLTIIVKNDEDDESCGYRGDGLYVEDVYLDDINITGLMEEHFEYMLLVMRNEDIEAEIEREVEKGYKFNR